ncbi:MAG: DUF2911 domain-containing protein [Bacteroidetes bacterium]|nr:MAG: DUF2911 domain-containing protein [Bacteroidota bacterium]
MIKFALKISGIFALMLLSTVAINAQKASPAAEATGQIGKAAITINYSQPGVKGREIYGDLVPYGEVWRVGANEATVFEVSTDVKVGGEKLKAGKYGLWVIPGKKEWTWIFSSTWDTWGTNYDPANDVLRVKGSVDGLDDLIERMTFTIGNGHVELHWSTTLATLNVKG